MENLDKIISILQYLLPGFLAAWVFYGFTSFPKPSEFERVVQALIFTLVIQLFVSIEGGILLRLGKWTTLGQWNKQSELRAATLTAVVIGLLFSYLANGDGFHKIARRLRFTRETSYPSEWFGAFLNNVTYVVLHMKDERRLYGWPVEWPSSPQSGHFQLQDVSWLIGEKEEPIKGVNSVLVSVKDVKWVEFLEKTSEVKSVEEGIKSTAAVLGEEGA